MRIAVFGTGGVGGYFGGKLAQAGEEVIFIARGEHLQALQQYGLRVDSIKGDFTVAPAQASDDPGQVGPVDYILLGVKAWQVPAAAQAMLPMVGEETCVVPLQNGVDAPAQLSEVVGAQHVLGGLCRISAYIAGPGHICHVGIEPSIAFGELDGTPSPRVERLRAAFQHTGVTVQAPPDIQVSMWEKFIFIAAVSGVGAVTRAPLGVMRSLPETRQLLLQALEEVASLGRARGVNLAADAAARILANIDGMGAGVLASMQRDIMEGRRSELDAQNGSVVRMGQESGVDTPLHRFLYASLLPQEKRARAEVQF